MRLTGRVFRAHHPRWAVKPTSGEGAARHGGRFNPVGWPALSTALGLETAWLEAQQGFAYKALPMTMCAYEVDCEDVVDLTSPDLRDRYGVTDRDLGCAWEDLVRRRVEPATWTLAKRLVAEGAAGILVESFATGRTRRDVNAVFWRWTDSLPHQVLLVDDEARLPRNDLSWR